MFIWEEKHLYGGKNIGLFNLKSFLKYEKRKIVDEISHSKRHTFFREKGHNNQTLLLGLEQCSKVSIAGRQKKKNEYTVRKEHPARDTMTLKWLKKHHFQTQGLLY